MIDLHFDEDAREKLFLGVEKISRAVKSTLGAAGETVLMESRDHLRGITVTKDGVTVAKSIVLKDPVENLAARIIKQAAEKTAAEAGDGTTTSIVLAEALVNNGEQYIEKYECNKTDVLRNLEAYCEQIIESLRSKAVDVDGEMLVDVAKISANMDEEVGEIIADTYDKVGDNGIVTVERSPSFKTYSEVTDGIKVERGYTSGLFVNDQKKDECVLDDCYVLVSDQEIGNILNIEGILKPIINQNKKLLIVAPCAQNVINTLAANVMKNGLKICNILPPQFGYKKHEMMQDIAMSIGAKYFSESTGDDLSLITMEDLGHVKKAIINKSSTILVKSENKNKAEIEQRVEELIVQRDMNEDKAEKEFISERIASLLGGIGVIYVGGKTDLEQKERYDRVDDAVCAVRAALKEGILPGGGSALYEISDEWFRSKNFEKLSESEKVACMILHDSLSAPLEQILKNARRDFDQVETGMFGNGYDVKNDKNGDMVEMGIIDPFLVTKEALKNAVSVAITLLSTNVVVTNASNK